MPKRPQRNESRVWHVIRSRQANTKKSIQRPNFKQNRIWATSRRKAQLARLDVIQNTAMRIITGAFKGTSSKSLEVECNLPPLKLKRKETTLKYWARSSALREKLPLNNMIGYKTVHDYRKHKLKNRPPYSIRMRELLTEYGMGAIKTQPPSHTQLANVKSINPRSELSKIIDKNTTKIEQTEKITNKYTDRRYSTVIQIYTDGSKYPENNRVGCAKYKFKLDGNLTVYTSELLAILMALRWAKKNKLVKFVILTDSLSSVQSINSGKSRTRQDILDQILRDICKILDIGLDINIDWCPSHCNVASNEMADIAAKQAMDTGVELELLPTAKEVYPVIKNKIRDEWQSEWAGHVNHRQMIDPNLQPKITQYSENRKLDIIYTRL